MGQGVFKIAGEYSVYCHENKVNGKKYFGLTKQRVKDRWGKDGAGYKDSPKFWNAIKKYGWDAFEHRIVGVGLTAEDASKLERLLITAFRTNGTNGYNIESDGIDGKSIGVNTKNRLREINLGCNNPMSKSVVQLSLDGDVKIIWDCITDVAKHLGLDRRRIGECAKGIRDSYGGYRWEFE